MRVLITSGATIEKIDSVRFITNFSTGKTGAELANYFASKNCRVFYLCSLTAKKFSNAETIETFESFKDLNHKIKNILKSNIFDCIIHLAAVSDYSIKEILHDRKKINLNKKRKLNSSKSLTINLERNFKILNRLSRYCINKPLIVGFKLTHTNNKQEVVESIKKLKCDVIVHNDVGEINSNKKRKFYIYSKNKLINTCSGRKKLGHNLLMLSSKRLKNEKNDAEV